MKRLVRGGLAFGLGLGLTLAGAHLGNQDRRTTRQTILGNLSVEQYCRAEFGFSAAAVNPTGEYSGWRCWDMSGAVPVRAHVDVDRGCTLQYATDAHGVPIPGTDKYWTCVSGSARQ